MFYIIIDVFWATWHDAWWCFISPREVPVIHQTAMTLKPAAGKVIVHCLPGEEMAPRCTMWRRHVAGGSVMLWAVFCCKALGPDIHVDEWHILHTLSLLQSKCTSLLQQYSLMAVVSRIIHSATLQKMFRNCSRNKTKSWLGGWQGIETRQT